MPRRGTARPRECGLRPPDLIHRHAAEADPSGPALSSSGAAPTYGYAGMFLDQTNGLYLTANRAYDPYSARWLSRDPAGEAGGINLYAYVGGDPVNYVDPPGLWQITVSGGAGIGGAVTFGDNGGQWNAGAYIGSGEGFGAEYDPEDSGCHQPGPDAGVQAGGELGIGEGISGSVSVNQSGSSASVSVGGPGVNANVGTGGAGVSYSYGASTYVGGGGVVYGP